MDEDLVQMMLNAATGSKSFVMATAIHFIDDFANGLVQMAGQYSVMTYSQTRQLVILARNTGHSQVDAQNANLTCYLPCEPAACYCYQRYRPMDFVLNVENERDFINSEFFKIGGNKAMIHLMVW